MTKKRYTGLAKRIRDNLIDPAMGFNGMLEHLANHAHSFAAEAAKDGHTAAANDYHWLRDQLDRLSLKAQEKGL